MVWQRKEKNISFGNAIQCFILFLSQNELGGGHREGIFISLLQAVKAFAIDAISRIYAKKYHLNLGSWAW